MFPSAGLLFSKFYFPELSSGSKAQPGTHLPANTVMINMVSKICLARYM